MIGIMSRFDCENCDEMYKERRELKKSLERTRAMRGHAQKLLYESEEKRRSNKDLPMFELPNGDIVSKDLMDKSIRFSTMSLFERIKIAIKGEI